MRFRSTVAIAWLLVSCAGGAGLGPRGEAPAAALEAEAPAAAAAGPPRSSGAATSSGKASNAPVESESESSPSGSGGVPAGAETAPVDGSGKRTPASEPTSPASSPAEPVDLPRNTRVLHLGDSFAGALGYELNRLLTEHEVRGFLKYEKSTYIPTWAWSKELPLLLSRYRPDLVLITLGGNELEIPDPEQRAKTVQRLVKRLEGVPCVWVGIPVWEGADPTLMEVIEHNVAPCLFYDSSKHLPDMARAGDGIHPSKSARTHWAERLVDWLQHQVAPTASEAWVWRAEVQPE